jgi:hypothetical protein
MHPIGLLLDKSRAPSLVKAREIAIEVVKFGATQYVDREAKPAPF